MANDSQRDKARAAFGKSFFENTKSPPQPKNSMAALQKRANARPIPTFKDGGMVSRRAIREAENTAKRVEARMAAGNYAEGGDVDRYKNKLDRKTADIESDYKKALAKGKNEGVAKAKYEQRMADAKDDYAKWTGGDRTGTKAAEKAAAPKRVVRQAGIGSAPAPAAVPAQEITVTGRKSLDQMKPAERASTYRSAFQSGRAGAAQEASAKANAPKSFQQKKASKLEALRAAAEAPGASRMAKDRYNFAKESGMIGSVEGYAAGGAGKVRKGMVKGK